VQTFVEPEEVGVASEYGGAVWGTEHVVVGDVLIDVVLVGVVVVVGDIDAVGCEFVYTL